MINKINLKFGEAKDELLNINVKNVNVLVGANNSGKSLFLKELYYFLSGKENNNKIIDSIQFNKINESAAKKLINENIFFDPYNGFYQFNSKISYSTNVNEPFEQDYTYESILSDLTTGTITPGADSLKYVLSHQTKLLNGVTRLSSFEDEEISLSTIKNGYSEKDESIITWYINNPDKFNLLKKYIYDAFKKYLIIYPSGQYARFALSDTDIDPNLELSLKPDAQDFFRSCMGTNEISDGIKAYIGTISEILSNNSEILLIDEPEAFLHPPLSKKLGSVICEISQTLDKKIFITTHSADFLMGCMEKNIDMNLIRLTYQNGISTATPIDGKVLEDLTLNPLLRSTNVLNGIFYKNVVVTESDSDRAFYQEINHRLKEFNTNRSIEDCLFINAQNKQTVGWITKLLRKIGIPTVSIIDLDMIKDNGGMFTSYLSSVGIPSIIHESLASKKTKLKSQYEQNTELKTKGIYYLQNKLDYFELAKNFINELTQYGLFVVPSGELESWLPDIEAYGHGNYWLTTKFENMGMDPNLEGYTKPTDDDVWKFIYDIKLWFNNPEKLGMTIY